MIYFFHSLQVLPVKFVIYVEIFMEMVTWFLLLLFLYMCG